MKNTLIFLIFFITNCEINAQNYTGGINDTTIVDSLKNGSNPGLIYLKYLESKISTSPDFNKESDNDHSIFKEIGFWENRIPFKLSDPIQKYVRKLNPIFPPIELCTMDPDIFNGNWENIGPVTTTMQQGEVFGLWIDPTNIDHILIGIRDGGLWSTTDGGSHWLNLSDNFLGNGCVGVNCIEGNPNGGEENELYLGTYITGGDNRNYATWPYGHGIWHSMDYGATWQLDNNGVVDDLTQAYEIQIAPFKVTTTNQQLVLATSGDIDESKLLRKIGTNGLWADITPQVFAAFGSVFKLAIRNIEFVPDIPGRAYIGTDIHPSKAALYQVDFDLTTGNIISWIKIKDETFNSALVEFANGEFNEVNTYRSSYAGILNGKKHLYVSASIGGAGHDGEQATILDYNITDNTWNYIYKGYSNTWMSRHTSVFSVHPSNPNMIYVGGGEPGRIFKVGNNWQHETMQSV